MASGELVGIGRSYEEDVLRTFEELSLFAHSEEHRRQWAEKLRLLRSVGIYPQSHWIAARTVKVNPRYL